ncbi:MAG: hypothetical protein GXO10_02665 [Crenarchaeota archaeon]|nr:hypothetical protein [Thermoproteota archaeon]
MSTGKISFLRRLGPDVADEDLDELADIVLGILDLVGGVIRGRTRLQKIMFLLKYEHGLNIPADFKPYKYGPYSRDLDLALRYLEEKGYIEQVEVEASDDPESKPNKVMVEYVCDISLLSDPDISADRGLH